MLDLPHQNGIVKQHGLVLPAGRQISRDYAQTPTQTRSIPIPDSVRWRRCIRLPAEAVWVQAPDSSCIATSLGRDCPQPNGLRPPAR